MNTGRDIDLLPPRNLTVIGEHPRAPGWTVCRDQDGIRRLAPPPPKPRNPEPWFRSAIIDGFQRLLVLRLDGQPPADAVHATAAVWFSALWALEAWEQDRDQDRIAAGFLALAQTCDRWPAPKHLRERLPPRKENAKPEARTLSGEEVKANLARLRRLLSDNPIGQWHAEERP